MATQTQTDTSKLLVPTLTATSDMGLTTFSLSLAVDAAATVQNVTPQLFVHNTLDGKWNLLNPTNAAGAPAVWGLFPGQTNVQNFTKALPLGTYDSVRILLFTDGTYSKVVFDQTIPFTLTVSTSQTRLLAPALVVDWANATDAAGIKSIPYEVHLPADYPISTAFGEAGGFFTMAKGSGGWSGNGWVNFAVRASHAVPWTLDPTVTLAPSPDPYLIQKGVWNVPVPAAPGLYNLQFGLFAYTWGAALVWIYPGENFEIGGDSWYPKADRSKLPSIAAALSYQSAPFAIGGNFGNALASIGAASNVAVNYFASLIAQVGCRVIRTNFDADKYLSDVTYTHLVDQFVNAVWLAGAVPQINPQDMPQGEIPALITLQQMIATKYAGTSLIIGILNEPHGYATWAAWKPVATEVATAIRAIWPDCVIVCDAEGYSKDMRGAAAAPITEVKIDFYGWHPYLAPSDLALMCGSGLPVYCEEYHDATPDFHAALQSLVDVKLIAAWAWTTPGQDSLNLVASVDGAILMFTPTGTAMQGFYTTWLNGGKVVVPPPVVAPPPPVPGLTLAQVQALLAPIVAQISALQTSVAALQGSGVTPPVLPAPVRICVHGAYTTASGEEFGADAYFSPGSVIPWSVAHSTPDAPLYESVRYAPGTFSYHLPAPAGDYTLTLYFAEGLGRGATKAGQRLFNVAANGVTLLTNFDVFAAAGGQGIGVIKSFPVTSTGSVVVTFVQGPGSVAGATGMVCALELVPLV